MTRALLLGAGSSWAAYEMGALEHLCAPRARPFDVYAGAGIGAMNAAFAACGKLDELGRFWDRANIRSLIGLDVGRLLSGPLCNRPQRAFVSSHISAELLANRGVQLLVTALDLHTGTEVVLRYPGCAMPLVDGIMAAVATSGLLPPVPFADKLLAEATFVESVPMVAVSDLGRDDEVIAVLPAAPDAAGRRRSYRTWRSVLERALALNLAQDVRQAIRTHADAQTVTSEISRAITEVDTLLSMLDDPALATSLRARAAAVFSECAADSVPNLVAIVPSTELEYPLWRFRRREMAAARALGRRDAEALVP